MDIAWFLLLLPLVATVAILLHLHRKPDMAIFASVGSAALCFLIALAVAFGGLPQPAPFEWITLPGLDIDMGMIFDPLSKGMLLIVTGIGLLIHIYSIGYMAHDPSRGRFFGGLSIFMFSMTGIVLADNLIMLFLFWEGVGLSSYLLIGFWYEKESAAQAANKAFVCNRLADFGFMIGILTFWFLMGTVSIKPEILALKHQENISALPQVGTIINPGEIAPNHTPYIISRHGTVPVTSTLLTIMVVGLFCGCVGKSAMFPLHVWLPDAMEGPTPVSALIHAATMVAAGVYMLCRVYPLLLLSPLGLNIIAVVGCFTAIFAALIAVQQNDIKRILAYSTLSQLGYMVMAVGCGGPDAAMFHLATHACFKALLFLAAGSVIHALHEEQDIWKMGGLSDKIPLTFWTFAIGMLALIGFPPFAGFFSKDYLLSVAHAYHPGFYWVGVFTAFLTAFYMTRLVVVAFFGPARTPAAQHPHESPRVMTIPLILLAIPSAIIGWPWLGLQGYFHGWSDGVLRVIQPGAAAAPAEGNILFEMILPGGIVLLGLGLAYYLYWGKATDPLNLKVLANKFYFDEFYDRSLVGGQQLAARFLNWIDSWILGGLIVRGAAYFSVGVGEIFRLFQTGSLQGYAFFFSLGGILLIYFTLFAH